MSQIKPVHSDVRTLRLRLSAEERDFFINTARKIDVPHNKLIRHLIRYVLRENTNWGNLLNEFKELPGDVAVQLKKLKNGGADKAGNKKVSLSTQLAPGLHSDFVLFAEKWGTTPGLMLRRLILLYNIGKIKRNSVLG